MSDGDLETAKRQLLHAAVADIQSSVKGNDQKALAALVVHGLLFAGALNIITRLGPIYKNALDWQRILGAVVLVIAVVAFFFSVAYLLLAISPYRPTELERKLECKVRRVFFPLRRDLDREDPFRDWHERVDGLTSPDILKELVAEALKLADILDFESSKAKLGYRWLACELVAVAAFFGLAAGVASSQV